MQMSGLSDIVRFIDKGHNRPNKSPVSSPVLNPVPMSASIHASGASSLNASQALKVLTFAGKNFDVAPHLKIEADFVKGLESSENTIERAGIAEMLGRAQSITALPALEKAAVSDKNVSVRIAAIRAVGDVGVSTHPDSFTRGQLVETLIKQFDERKTQLEQLGTAAPMRMPAGQGAKVREAMLEEVNTITETLGRLNSDSSKSFLHNQYSTIFDAAENNIYRAQEMVRAMQIAEDDFVSGLEEEFQKPIQDIARELGPIEVEKLKQDVEVVLKDGTSVPLTDVRQEIQSLQRQHQIANELINGLVDGMAEMDDNQTNAYLKKALGSNSPSLKAKVLGILGERRQLSYSSDIYPFLRNENPEIRQVALNALVGSNERTAKQKVMELLNPRFYMEIVGNSNPMAALMGGEAEEPVQDFQAFLQNIAFEGDRYANHLRAVAVDKDYDTQARQVAMLVLGQMAGPMSGSLASETVKKARQTLKEMSIEPTASTPEQKESIRLQSNLLLVSLKDDEAVDRIFEMLRSPMPRLTDEQQMTLLSSIYQALTIADESPMENSDGFAHKVLDVMASDKTSFEAEAIETIRANFEPRLTDLLSSQDGKDDLEKIHEQYARTQTDQEFLDKVKGRMDNYRPYLMKLLNHNTVPETRMLAARVLGTTKDLSSVEALIEKVRDPLGGMIDWNKNPSYRGKPALDGANIRLNALVALGRIGSSEALDVMTAALNDVGLRRYVPEHLAKLAPDANDNRSWREIKSTREELVRVMANPDTSRLQRAVRIAASNALYQFKKGDDELKEFITTTDNPDFRRQAASALLANRHGLEPDHPDHDLIKDMLNPGLGVEKLHAQGITGKGVEMAIIDGGYVDKGNTEAFQDRVKLPPSAKSPEHSHPTMVMTTAAGNGHIKGVAPDALVYSDKWPDFAGADPMDVYKKIIEGKLRGENNIKVINNSWGFNDNSVLMFKDVRDVLKEFKKVVDLAERAGIQIVFSAGNSGEEIGIPSVGTLGLFGMDIDKLTSKDKEILDYCLDKVILVGASNTRGFDDDRSQHVLADFSSAGDALNDKLTPTILAPGVDMSVYSYENGERPIELVNGTSFSGPYVSGLFSLMFDANPNLTPAQARKILIKTAVKLDGYPDTHQGYGEVDSIAAVEAAKNFGKRGSKRS